MAVSVDKAVGIVGCVHVTCGLFRKPNAELFKHMHGVNECFFLLVGQTHSQFNKTNELDGCADIVPKRGENLTIWTGSVFFSFVSLTKALYTREQA